MKHIKLIKSCKSVVVIFIVTACVTTKLPEGPRYRPEYLEPFTITTNETPNAVDLRTLLSHGDGNKSTSDADTYKKLFGYYCSSGKQVKSLTHKLRGIIPARLKGVTVDIAAANDEYNRKLMRDFIGRFYEFGIGYTEDHQSGTIFPFNWDDSGLFATKTGSSPSYSIMGSHSKTSDEFTSYFKAQQLDSTGEVEKNGSIYSPDFFSPYRNFAPVLVKFEDSDSRVIVSLAGRVGVFSANFSSKHDVEDGIAIDTRKAKAVGGAFILVPKMASPIVVDTGNNGDVSPDHNRQFYLVKPIIPMEMRVFSAAYTMLIPPRVQRKLWQNPVRMNVPEKYHKGYGFFIDPKSLKFVFSDAVADRGIMWRYYVKTFTSVKESQTGDPQLIDYDVSIDLNVFCEYGRPVNDLVSQ